MNTCRSKPSADSDAAGAAAATTATTTGAAADATTTAGAAAAAGDSSAAGHEAGAAAADVGDGTVAVATAPHFPTYSERNPVVTSGAYGKTHLTVIASASSASSAKKKKKETPAKRDRASEEEEEADPLLFEEPAMPDLGDGQIHSLPGAENWFDPSGMPRLVVPPLNSAGPSSSTSSTSTAVTSSSTEAVPSAATKSNASGVPKAALQLDAAGVNISKGGKVLSFGDGGVFSTEDEIISHIAASKAPFSKNLQKFNKKSKKDKLVSISASITSAKGAYNSDGTPIVGGRLYRAPGKRKTTPPSLAVSTSSNSTSSTAVASSSTTKQAKRARTSPDMPRAFAAV